MRPIPGRVAITVSIHTITAIAAAWCAHASLECAGPCVVAVREAASTERCDIATMRTANHPPATANAVSSHVKTRHDAAHQTMAIIAALIDTCATLAVRPDMSG